MGTDQLDDDIEVSTPKDIAPEKVEEIIPEVMPTEAEEKPKQAVAKISVGSVDTIKPIAATNVDEAARIAGMVCIGGMVPKAYEVIVGGKVDWGATKARLAIAIIKGASVGFDPVTAINTIYIVNGKPSIYGDGGKALIQRGNHLEYEDVEYSGDWAKKDRACKVTLKRKGQEKPYIREFTQRMAERAGLTTKRGGVWKIYDDRMLYWRAWTWAARDGFADDLHGMSIVEEVADIAAPPEKTDIGSLD